MELKRELNIRRIKLPGKVCDVVTNEKYTSNPELYDPSYTAIETEIDGEKYALPIINRFELGTKVGVVPGSCVSFYNPPQTAIDKESYSMDKVIDYSDAKGIKDLIERSMMVRNLENEVLVNPDNVTVLRIDDNDSPEMKALKEAINYKCCDINLYANRFGGNFANDRRILNDNTITLQKLKKYANALDMNITMTISDKNSNVPNPIGKKIQIDLTGGDSDE